jgi:hypothetical protein
MQHRRLNLEKSARITSRRADGVCSLSAVRNRVNLHATEPVNAISL